MEIRWRSVLLAALLAATVTTCAPVVSQQDCADAIKMSKRDIDDALSRLEDALDTIKTSNRTRAGQYLVSDDGRLDIMSAFHNLRDTVNAELRVQVFDNGCAARRR